MTMHSSKIPLWPPGQPQSNLVYLTGLLVSIYIYLCARYERHDKARQLVVDLNCFLVALQSLAILPIGLSAPLVGTSETEINIQCSSRRPSISLLPPTVLELFPHARAEIGIEQDTISRHDRTCRDDPQSSREFCRRLGGQHQPRRVNV
ncbi:hypothetical protein IWX90DRAFT_177652 [Phyllosticta citrichinensis]|uniref:Uncharacterized protein n=1 Tax=Phyllosticta citrichinensis TaxID=1130410 RepID=A0ABR1XW39_9PEZI